MILKSDYFPKVLLEKQENGEQIFQKTPFWTIRLLNILSRTNGQTRKTPGIVCPNNIPWGGRRVNLSKSFLTYLWRYKFHPFPVQTSPWFFPTPICWILWQWIYLVVEWKNISLPRWYDEGFHIGGGELKCYQKEEEIWGIMEERRGR